MGRIQYGDADPSAWQKSCDLMTNNRKSTGKWHLEFFTFSGLIQIYQLIFGNKKFRHIIIATESSIIYCWVFGQ